MKREHPFLLLGILSAMTMHEVELSIPIHEEFLRLIAGKVVTAAEKSLDIIQGIIVQVAWSASSTRRRFVRSQTDSHFNQVPDTS